MLHLDVDGAGGVVEDQDGRVDQQGAGDGDPLALPAGERVAPLAHHGVVPVGQPIDETGGTGRLGCGHDLLEGGVGATVGDVVPDRHGEEEGLVEDDTDVGPQAREGEVADVVPVDPHGAPGGVVEAGQHAGHGRLAAAGAPHQSDGLARVQVQIQVVQDLSRTVVPIARLREQAVVGVGEADVVELDVTLAVDQVDGVGPVDDRGLLVDDLVDPVGRGRGALAHHDQHPEHHEGGLHHHQVEVERDDGRDGQLLVDDHPAADEQHEDEADLGEVLHERGEAGAEVGVLDVAPLDPVGRIGQLPQLLLLGGEAAHDAHAVDVLVHDGRHLGQPGLDEPRNGEERLPHLHSDDVDERHGRHGDESQRHADGEHEGERDQRDGALHQDHRGERQVHLHRADVRVGPRDQLPGLNPVVEGEGHAREVLVEDVAQVEFDRVRHLEEVGA